MRMNKILSHYKLLMDYTHKYAKYKTKYLNLKKLLEEQNLNQKGGGAWDTYSNSNDNVQDMILTYGFVEFTDDEKRIVHRDKKTIKVKLDKLFNDFKKGIKKVDPKIKNPDESAHNLSMDYLGVVIELVLNQCDIPKEYLIRALFHAYKNLVRTYVTKDASGWFNYDDRLFSLHEEILLLNYVINKGTPLNAPDKLLDDQYMRPNKISNFLKQLKGKDKENIIDYIFLRHKKVKSTYPFQKYFYEPILDPRILDEGTIMKGYAGDGSGVYFIVEIKNSKHNWKEYDPTKDVFRTYLDIEMLYDMYVSYDDGAITKINKKDIREM
jgi:hypothetical protein